MTFMKTAVVLVLCSVGLWAHHSYPTFYDLNQQVILKGKVTAVAFAEPHVMMTIETKGSGTWQAEWTNPAALARRGVVDGTVKIGDVLEIEGSPAWNPNSRVVSALRVVLRPADGWRWESGAEQPKPRVIE